MLLPVMNWDAITAKKNALAGAISEENLSSMGKVGIIVILKLDGYSGADSTRWDRQQNAEED